MRILFIPAIALLALQCTTSEEKTDVLVQQKLESLRAQLRLEKLNQCENGLLQEIELEADSILILMAKRTKYDSLTIPTDSIRPLQPEVHFPEYKKPVKPNEQAQ
ncbi:MAG TPA: hypothetical protein VFX48_06935 [Saprospiraceae bacterium]|nr:hypothetical protein [Saprospiraceae bacterium]